MSKATSRISGNRAISPAQRRRKKTRGRAFPQPTGEPQVPAPVRVYFQPKEER
jgi:hypothetical protein